ncbi:MAG: DNA/RNA non-specific endonuclease [Alistipes sp.]
MTDAAYVTGVTFSYRSNDGSDTGSVAATVSGGVAPAFATSWTSQPENNGGGLFTQNSGGAPYAAPILGTATATLSGLKANTGYTVTATATATNGSSPQSPTATFTTLSDTAPQTEHTAWLELPAQKATSASWLTKSFYANNERNYTIYYDRSMYTAAWVAYPLVKSQTTGGRSGSWKQTPGIDRADQINVWTSSYGVSIGSDIYARGHQIPDGDRSGVPAMQSQTYYATNSTPQIQNQFNGGIWNQLEDGVRGAIPASDTLYVVTGAIFKTVGGNETVTYIQPQNETTKQCPVPNYYYKVLLKCQRSGTTITSIATIGFWYEHKPYTEGGTWANYAQSVDAIEALTGYDFFANIPTALQTAAEKNTSWTTFRNF